MSEFVLAAPGQTVGGAVSADGFAAVARSRWPDARPASPPDGSGMIAGAWIRREPDSWYDILLYLHGDGLALSIDARERAVVAEAAAWWRSVVAATVPELWLFDATGVGWSVLRPGDGADAVFPGG